MKVLLVLSLFICISLAAFPKNFLWGSATASYQVEGAWNISRGLSIWDVFSHTPGLGFKNYRFSLSWSRLFPTGRPPANPVGFKHYSDVIDALLANGIEPFVTLYHWDLPEALPNTWLASTIVDDFALYANAVFGAYGDRVKKWITFNEPLSFTWLGYGTGIHAPGRCSNRTVCTAGNSNIAAHNVLLAHSATVNIYKKGFQPQQGGVIGITLNCDWAEPYSSSEADQRAAERHLEFQLSWFADPIFKGDYPESMKILVGDRLPRFTQAQQLLINGSWDYFGLNHYTSGYSRDNPRPIPGGGWSEDQRVTVLDSRDGRLIGPQADSSWLYVVPWGIHMMLRWVAERYGNPPIYITENGVDVPHESSIPLPAVLNDQFRVNFYEQYISNVSRAIVEGVDVRGYFAWSLMDNFEWADGYTKRFGLHYVDYAHNLTRYPKDSAKWFATLINETSV